MEVREAAVDGTLPVTLVAGEAASGLACITAQYLEELLADSPEKRAEAGALRGRFGLHAREGDVQVTIVFGEHGVNIEEGLRDPDVVMEGSIQTLMNVLAGNANPVWNLCRRRLALRATLRRPLFGHRAFRLMRLPDARSGSWLLPVLVFTAAGAVTAVVIVLLVMSGR